VACKRTSGTFRNPDVPSALLEYIRSVPEYKQSRFPTYPNMFLKVDSPLTQVESAVPRYAAFHAASMVTMPFLKSWVC
jgi:hypothetical protein